MARPLSRTSAVEVWPAFTDAMLAFVLVLVLLLAYQVGRSIEIAGPNQQAVLKDQRSVKALVDSLDLQDVAVTEELGRQKITFGSEVLFESGSPDLKPSGQVLIGRLAAAIAGQGVRTLEEVQVAGHTDNVPTGQTGYSNWELAADRATNVVRSLQGAGIDPRAVRLSATGYGEFTPIVANDSDADRARNRRIEMRLFYGQPDAAAQTAP